MGYWERDDEEWLKQHPHWGEGLALFVMVVALVVFVLCLTGCETVQYLHERNLPAIPCNDSNCGKPARVMRPVFKPHFEPVTQSEWEDKV
jgi:hypothetical protein